MKNMKRKGFTIVELVIVIAVVAILAAVLIPTFGSLIKKANLSADAQAVRQMNVALTSESVSKKPENIEDAVELLDAAGYNAFETLIPVSKGHYFYWLSSENTIVLVDENLKVVLPKNLENEDLTDEVSSGKAYNLKRGYLKVDVATPETLIEAIEKGQSVKLDKNFNLGSDNIEVKAGEDVVIELADDATISVGYSDQLNGRHYYAIENRGVLTIKGKGIIESRGIANYGTIIIEDGVTIKTIDANGGAAIWNYADGEVIINGGTLEATSGDKANDDAGIGPEPGIINNSGKVTINAGTFTALYTGCYAVISTGELTINGGTFEAYRGVVSATSGTATINGGTFTQAGSDSSGHVLHAAGSVVFNVLSGKVQGYSISAGNITFGENVQIIKK